MIPCQCSDARRLRHHSVQYCPTLNSWIRSWLLVLNWRLSGAGAGCWDGESCQCRCRWRSMAYILWLWRSMDGGFIIAAAAECRMVLRIVDTYRFSYLWVLIRKVFVSFGSKRFSYLSDPKGFRIFGRHTSSSTSIFPLLPHLGHPLSNVEVILYL